MTGPGWHGDVQRPGWLRYWDGYRWTDHWAPVPVPLDEERAAARRAKTSLAVAAPAMMLGTVGSAYAFRHIRDDIEELFDVVERTPAGERVRFDADTVSFDSGWYLLSQSAGLTTLIAGIFFVIWLYRASVDARALGLPQRYGARWAWLGFLIPIANLFVPYCVTRDALPPGHPARTLVVRWWAAYLVASMSGLLVVAAALIDVPALLVAVTILAAGVWLMAAVSAWQVIDAVTGAHEAAVQRRGGAST